MSTIEGIVRKIGQGHTALLNVDGDGIRVVDEPGVNIKVGDTIELRTDGTVWWKGIFQLQRVEQQENYRGD